MEEIRILINYLNERTKEYDEGKPTISDKEWDSAYFKLVELEKETGIVYNDSPTQKIIYQTVAKLNKVEHNHPMLSLDKTKEVSVVEDFLSDKTALCMAKMDGLTCSLRYINGNLVSAETRGNGIIGEDILHNALVIPSIPKKIPYENELIVDGEIICTYKDFENFKEDYKNPRNFAAGSIRLLDSAECSKRHLTFVAWDIIKGLENLDNLSECLSTIKDFNFTIVPYEKVNNIEENIKDIVKLSEKYPIDGAVFKFDSRSYGKTLGKTEHHFKNAIAYKFYDETYESYLKTIEWSLGRTGVLTPIAIFEPIDIDGTKVSRASLHNISIMEELWDNPWFSGLKVEVFKANQIIPQIKSIATSDKVEKELKIPTRCPICGGDTIIKDNDGVKTLFCSNPDCDGKFVNRLDHFCSKKGLDIKGLSKVTLNKLIDWGWVNNIYELYSLYNFKDEWIKKPGFGITSVNKILEAIEESKKCDLNAFISALGIPLVGRTLSKEIVKYYTTWEDFRDAIGGDWFVFDGFGTEISYAINHFDYSEADKIASLMNFNTIEEKNNDTNMEGITFCITGKLKNWKNRDELKSFIESAGGRVVGSMSSKVNYLINNDISSNSAKNRSAKENGIPIITEESFIEAFGQK